MDVMTTTTKFNNLIESKVGMSIDEIKSRSSDTVACHINNLTGRVRKIGNLKVDLSYRGNMLLAIGKIANNIDGLFDRTFGTGK